VAFKGTAGFRASIVVKAFVTATTVPGPKIMVFAQPYEYASIANSRKLLKYLCIMTPRDVRGFPRIWARNPKSRETTYEIEMNGRLQLHKHSATLAQTGCAQTPSPQWIDCALFFDA
jgi:hypothetical protein